MTSDRTRYLNKDRWRCLQTGCNPLLKNEKQGATHKEKTGHRVAKWPVRSAKGISKADKRNKSGYYDKYNVGEKSAAARGLIPGVRGGQRGGPRKTTLPAESTLLGLLNAKRGFDVDGNWQD